MVPNDVEEEIVKLLERHPKGMKISDIAKNLNIRRQTVSKYVYGLQVAGLVNYREVGRSKICFLLEKKKGGRKGLTW